MNLRILSKLLGLLLLLVSISMFGCGVFAWLDPVELGREAVVAMFTSAVVTLLAGGILMLAGMGRIDKIPRREGVAVVGLGWVLATLFGSLPFLLCPPYLSWSAAFFETASGFTTTGATVIPKLEEWPRGLLLWRSVTQWLGGIGILVLFVAVLAYLGLGTKSLFRNESSFSSGEASTARIRDTAWMLLKIYLVISAVCMLGLKVLGMTWFNAVNHAMATVATGGFSPHSASVGYYAEQPNGWMIELWMSLFMILCSLNFMIFALLLAKRWDRLRGLDDAKWFVGMCVVVSLVIAAGLYLDPGHSDGVLECLRNSWFIVVSIASTSGFGTVDFDLWPTWCKALLALLMVVGGCSGSTAGGVKLNRLLVFLKSSLNEIVRGFRPNQMFRLTFNGQPVDESARTQATSFVAIYFMILALGAVIFALLQAGNPHSLEACLSASLATLSNIGPGFGDIGPTEVYDHLRESTLVFLAGLMILGRLELFAILVLFVPAVWRKY